MKSFGRSIVARAVVPAMLMAIVAGSLTVEPALAQQSLYFGPGEDTATESGAISGRQHADYSFSAKQGETFDVQLHSASLSLNLNIIEANSEVAIEAEPKPIGVRSWRGNMPRSGNFRIRLYLMGAARDEGKTVEYTLSVQKMKPRGGGGSGQGENSSTVTQLDYAAGGTGEYFVDDGMGDRKVSRLHVVLQPDGRAKIEVSLGGDGFIIHGTWDHGAGPEVKLNITHGFSGAQLKGWGTLTLRGRGEFDNMGLRFENLTQKTNHRLTFTAAKG